MLFVSLKVKKNKKILTEKIKAEHAFCEEKIPVSLVLRRKLRNKYAQQGIQAVHSIFSSKIKELLSFLLYAKLLVSLLFH